MVRIMLVDDEENIIMALRRSLRAPIGDNIEGASHNDVELFTSPTEALARVSEGVMFDIVICDYRMPEMDGVTFLKALREIQPDTVRFLLSGHVDLDGLLGAVNEAKIHRFIAKPWNDYSLRADISQALQLRNLQTENQRLADEVRQQQGVITQQELELRRLEAETPGITKVKRRADGGILFYDE